MGASKEWLERYAQLKGSFAPYGDLQSYFKGGEVRGTKMRTLSIGSIKVPTGELIAGDPFAILMDYSKSFRPYFIKAPTGEFPVQIAAAEIEEGHFRYAAARVLFSEVEPVSTVEALTGQEDLSEEFEPDDFFGFAVDAGLATVMDANARDAYCEFFKEWHESNPNGNIYDDFFADIFAESYKAAPEFQRPFGDWINWTAPGLDLPLPMFASGWGDGLYPAYFAFGEDGNVCQLLIEFINFEYLADYE